MHIILYVFKRSYTSRPLNLSIQNKNNIFTTRFFYSTEILNRNKTKIHKNHIYTKYNWVPITKKYTSYIVQQTNKTDGIDSR